MVDKLKQFTGTGDIVHLVNEFISEQEVYEYEVVGFQTYPHPETDIIVTSILIKFDEVCTNDYREKKRNRDREDWKNGMPF
ncbi:hypothetical protein [Staphylococcus simulans]|uniref:hypothetical protein n=1 Tax=Staphylococcus simulans TaxID=1286 RepID=UPI00071041DB|nr:hypothetical protein [Staphylococcus simulans]